MLECLQWVEGVLDVCLLGTGTLETRTVIPDLVLDDPRPLFPSRHRAHVQSNVKLIVGGAEEVFAVIEEFCLDFGFVSQLFTATIGVRG